MAGMARQGSASAYQGFSVCQPALGSALQWLPAIGTPELDDMINAFLPGPASIQDKRAHIAMDFFEYARQTGETFKFYPVPSASFTPLTASPATTLYDSGYGSNFNLSPTISEQVPWTQSSTTFTPSVSSSVGIKPRPAASKKSSVSSTRQHTTDFANHPGMRIMTKDGRDVTNSASRGCKTKEQRDHAHLMRIIKACDSCRRKKIRCDPSHKKRAASQASPAQAEQKPAKKSKKAQEPPPAPSIEAATDFILDGSLNTAFDFPSLDASSQEFEEYWNQFVSFEEPVAVPNDHFVEDFDFTSFIDSQDFSSPSSLSSASPSQLFTPFTPAASGTSPTVSTPVVDVAGDVSLDDPTVPYLNPDVLHGTNYVDFNLYSPGPDSFDEDPVLQMRDVSVVRGAAVERSRHMQVPDVSAWSVNELASSERPDCDPLNDVGPVNPALPDGPQSFGYSPLFSQVEWTREGGSSPERPVFFQGHSVNVDAPEGYAAQSPTVDEHTSSIVAANIVPSSVSLGSSPRPRRPPQDSPGLTGLPSYPESTPGVAGQLHSLERASAPEKGSRYCKIGSPSTKGLTGIEPHSWSVADGQHGVSQGTSVPGVPGVASLATELISTIPARRIVSGEVSKDDSTYCWFLSSIFFFQLAVFGLVSFLCASALQTHLASQANFVNILTFASLSLASLTSRCLGASSATRVASKTLPIPTASGIIDNVKSKIQAVDQSLRGLRSTASRRARDSVPRFTSVTSFKG
ncbi:hypothetical protein N656DRAFT_372298 [Canariomyces notabilis]|uniref:Zn(2)-C6 fungal-type domain-containing protein n=1 Tax=Canariomyces notabilis TaxID=2074819 RepID=A0AAN6QIB9_9PEZI|nr:hypothetical protein N656DRAFT_372298 [Canariomyces arenarius]